MSGQVLDELGNPMPNVTINVVEWGYDNVTDGTGRFDDYSNFTDVTFVPKRAGYTFTPSSITAKADGTDKTDLVFTATPVNVNAPTAATHALVGYVRDEGGNGVPGAMIYYQNGADKIYLGTSGPSGLYIVQGVPAGTSYSFVGAYHLGYDFSLWLYVVEYHQRCD